jgi:hypothetical protein
MSGALKAAILQQETITALIPYWGGRASDAIVGDRLRQILRANHWKPNSARRNAAGLRRFYEWATASGLMLPLIFDDEVTESSW